jgi:hypothetical protein
MSSDHTNMSTNNPVVIIDKENNTIVPPDDYMENKEYYDNLVKSLNSVRKRSSSTIKHIFLVIPGDDTPSEIDTSIMDGILDKLLAFIWETCRKKDNPPRFKVFGKNIISVEFLKPRRVDYDTLDINGFKLIKKPFKTLYTEVAYHQTTLDNYLKKK